MFGCEHNPFKIHGFVRTIPVCLGANTIHSKSMDSFELFQHVWVRTQSIQNPWVRSNYSSMFGCEHNPFKIHGFVRTIPACLGANTIHSKSMDSFELFQY